jgi:hypothetical protein
MNLWEVGQVKTTPGSLTYGKKHHLLIGNLWHNIQNTMQQYRTYMTVSNIHHSFQASLLHVGERTQLLSQVLFLFLYYTDCWWRMPTRSRELNDNPTAGCQGDGFVWKPKSNALDWCSIVRLLGVYIYILFYPQSIRHSFLHDKIMFPVVGESSHPLYETRRVVWCPKGV